MTCGTCGATIADKAIVCYRCGAPTAIPVAPQRPARQGGGVAWLVVLVLAVLLAVVAAMLPEGSTERYAVGAAAGITAVFGVVQRLRRGRG